MDISEPFFELESRRITFLDEYKSWLSKIALFIYYLLPKLCYYINPYIYPIFKPYFSRFRTAFCAEEYLAFNRAGVVHTSFLFKHK
jgi:hypothetical protein